MLIGHIVLRFLTQWLCQSQSAPVWNKGLAMHLAS
jgi:hypothetical protein